MAENNITVNDRKINKSNFYRTKRLFKTDDIDVDKALISEQSFMVKKIAFKYFVAYEDHDYMGLLRIKLTQMTGYVKCFDSNKTMSFRIVVCKLLKKY